MNLPVQQVVTEVVTVSDILFVWNGIKIRGWGQCVHHSMHKQNDPTCIGSWLSVYKYSQWM